MWARSKGHNRFMLEIDDHEMAMKGALPNLVPHCHETLQNFTCFENVFEIEEMRLFDDII